MRRVVPLDEARDELVFGSKAVGLGQAIRDGLPVPPGVALSGSIVEAVAAGERAAIKSVARGIAPLGVPLAFRSSAMDEDGAMAVPTDPDDVAWYDLGPGMGVPGNAVFAGHIPAQVERASERPDGLLHLHRGPVLAGAL